MGTYKAQLTRCCKLLENQTLSTEDMHISADFEMEGNGQETQEQNEAEMVAISDTVNTEETVKTDPIISDIEKKKESNKKHGKHGKSGNSMNAIKSMLNRTASEYRNDKMVRSYSEKQRNVTMNGNAIKPFIESVDDEINDDESEEDESANTTSIDENEEDDQSDSSMFAADEQFNDSAVHRKGNKKGTAFRGKRGKIGKHRYGSTSKNKQHSSKKKEKEYHVEITEENSTKNNSNDI